MLIRCHYASTVLHNPMKFSTDSQSVRTEYKIAMSDSVDAYLLALPIELIYRILDCIDILTIEISVRNVCTRLRAIIDTYRLCQVSFSMVVETLHLIDHGERVSCLDQTITFGGNSNE